MGKFGIIKTIDLKLINLKRCALNNLGRSGNKSEKKSMIFTAETMGVVLILFSVLCLVCLISGDKIFSVPGKFISEFLLGCFGYFSFILAVFGVFEGVLLLLGKKTGLSGKRKWLVFGTVFTIALITHTATMHGNAALSYGEYLARSYYMASEGGAATSSGGGAITGIIAYVFSAIFTEAGAYVILSIAFCGLTFLLYREFFGKGFKLKKKSADGGYVESSESENGEQNTESVAEVYPQKTESVVPPITAFEKKPDPPAAKQKLFVAGSGEFGLKTKRDLKNQDAEPIKIERTDSGLSIANSSYRENYTKDLETKLNYVKTPAKIDLESTLSGSVYGSYYNGSEKKNGETVVSAPLSSEKEIPYSPTDENTEKLSSTENTAIDEKVSAHDNYGDTYSVSAKPSEQEKPAIPFYEHDESDDAKTHAEDFSARYAEVPEPTETKTAPDYEPDVTEYAVPEINNATDREKENSADENAREATAVNRAAGRFTAESESEDNEELKSSAIKDRRTRKIFFGDESSEMDETSGGENATSERNRLVSEDRKENLSSRIEESSARENRLGSDRLGSERFSSDRLGSARRGFAEERSSESGVSRLSRSSEERFGARSQEEANAEPEKVKEVAPINREYFRPPFDLLETYALPLDRPKENHEDRMEIIKNTLAEFKIEVEPRSYIQGPSITRYEFMIQPGISVKKILLHDVDLKMRLAAKDGVRIEAPIPGKNLVGVEVANQSKVTVGLREVLEGLAGKKSKPDALMFAIGKNLVGEPISDNLAKGPHYLVAGATGSGKSVCLNVMITSLIMRYSPEELRLILIDPKRVEFRIYEHIPHLMIDDIINEPKKVIAVLTWAYAEMERRYKIFEECGGMIVDIGSYNENIASDTVPKMPRIVIVIDELADLMQMCKKDLESRICALAQKARSAGIHLVLATQRPSVDVITGTIKANLASRIAFKVSNFNDSMTILGEQGAEKLLGNGDMLYKNSTMPDYERYQGAYISSREVNNVVTYVKEHNKAYFDDELKDYLDKAAKPKQEESSSKDGDDDGNEMSDANNELLIKATALAIKCGTISISQIQRRFQIGYIRAAGLIDKMEDYGFISAHEGSKAREVFITREEFEDKFGPMAD